MSSVPSMMTLMTKQVPVTSGVKCDVPLAVAQGLVACVLEQDEVNQEVIDWVKTLDLVVNPPSDASPGDAVWIGKSEQGRVVHLMPSGKKLDTEKAGYYSTKFQCSAGTYTNGKYITQRAGSAAEVTCVSCRRNKDAISMGVRPVD